MPPTNRFPLLRLPLLPLELVIKDLTPLDKFILAITSNKIRKYLKGNPTKLDICQLKYDSRFDQLEVALRPSLIGVEYHIKVVVKTLAEWETRTIQDRVFDFYFEGKQYKAEYSYSSSKILDLYEIHANPKMSQETISSIIKLSSDIFNFQEIVSFEELSKKVVLPFVSKCSGVRCLHLTHATSQLTSDELSNLLENFSVRNFKLDWNVEEGFKYRKSLRYREMELFKAHWLTIDCLLNMGCEDLYADNVYLTVEELKKFLQKWLDGGLEKLARIHLSHSLQGFSWESVLNNIKMKSLGEEHEHLLWMRQYDAWEIRGSDGSTAAVYANNEFFFQAV